MKTKKSYYANDITLKYLDELKRGSLSDFINDVIEFMAEHNLTFLDMRDKILYAEKYEPLTDEFIKNLFLLNNQSATIQYVNDVNKTSIDNENVNVSKESFRPEVVKSKIGIHDKEQAEKFNLSIEEYLEIKEKAKKLNYDVETFINIKNVLINKY